MALLPQIHSPEDVKRLTIPQLKMLCDELREQILAVTRVNGGHLASNLGVVELTVAIHYVYACPQDKLLFDVGHQCYAHKLLTGRYTAFQTIRQENGISGFPRRDESVYDAFGSGHSGTAISAALGYALARSINNEKYDVAALIGDGAFMNGPSIEAFNHAGHVKEPMVVILNDNEMSISKNVGALSRYLNRLRAKQSYQSAKQRTKRILQAIPLLGPAVAFLLKGFKKLMRMIFVKGALFNDLGFAYLGPVDGHNLPTLIDALSAARSMQKPVVLHVVTKKGRGYKPAEKRPDLFHGILPANADTVSVSYSRQTGDLLEKLAREDEKLCVITAAMPAGTGVEAFAGQYPDRFFDVGISEEHAVTLAASLAAAGLKPYFVVYSTFLQRAYDQILHDVALQKLPVTFLISHAGFVGEDGATHQGLFDLSFLTHVPGATILAPSGSREYEYLLQWAHDNIHSPVFIRFGKHAAQEAATVTPMEQAAWPMERQGKDAVILAVGDLNALAMETAEQLAPQGIDCRVLNARILKPLPMKELNALADLPLIVLEENTVLGGFGAELLAVCAQQGKSLKLLELGAADAFYPHATIQRQREAAGLDASTVAEKIRRFVTEGA